MENEQVKREIIKLEETRKLPSKSEVIGSFIGMGMVGFCFGIGLMLAVKTVNNLQSVSWILAEFYFNRGLQRLYTGTCIILQKNN